jgi:saccharopine dehydrogenase-like NADP-dependent oxidoreductase
LVGSYVAKRLAGAGHEVHVYDWQPHRVMGVAGIHVHPEDATDAVGGMSRNGVVDMVVNMLPGSIGHVASTYLAESSYRIVDLSFSKFTPDRDDEKARDYGASILWDVGVAPGLSNMLLAVADRKMGPLAKAEVWVGGNPTGPYGEWFYMAPFSPTDVIAEYSRPARVIRDGEQVVLPALSQRHLIDVGERGEMEAFLTDGLRSVLSSIPAVEMSEFTVRWPGHIQKYIDERDAGTLDEEDVVRQWWYDHKIPEFTWMRVRAQNRKGEVMEWELEDYGGDDGHSMARSTGLVTACCIEAWLADPNMLPAGVHAPEVLSSEVISGIVETMRSVGVRIEGPDIL